MISLKYTPKRRLQVNLEKILFVKDVMIVWIKFSVISSRGIALPGPCKKSKEYNNLLDHIERNT